MTVLLFGLEPLPPRECSYYCCLGGEISLSMAPSEKPLVMPLGEKSDLLGRLLKR